LIHPQEKKKKILFVLIMEEKIPAQDFSLKDLPGASKIDVVSRIILSIFPKYTSILEPELQVFFTKSSHILTIRDLIHRKHPYDEIEIAALLKETLIDFYIEQKSINKDSLIFWHTVNDFESYLEKIMKDYPSCYYLHEKGDSINNYLEKMKIDNSSCFILGGRHDISDEHEQIVLAQKVVTINLGEKSYLASTCVTSVIFELEKILPH